MNEGIEKEDEKVGEVTVGRDVDDDFSEGRNDVVETARRRRRIADETTQTTRRDGWVQWIDSYGEVSENVWSDIDNRFSPRLTCKAEIPITVMEMKTVEYSHNILIVVPFNNS